MLYNDYYITGWTRTIKTAYHCGVSWAGIEWYTSSSAILIPTGHVIKLGHWQSIVLGLISLGIMLGSSFGFSMNVGKFMLGITYYVKLSALITSQLTLNTILTSIGGKAITVKVIINLVFAIVLSGSAIQVAMASTGLGSVGSLIFRIITLIGSMFIFHTIGSTFASMAIEGKVNNIGGGVKVTTNLSLLNDNGFSNTKLRKK